ncbi:MAG: M6 family metalloprotease domain-containing protein [Gemmatimonadetes bacterium]|nr:M6 family metalloprotease domain-containing protein [Gemmatimonadota bacterium]
MSRCGVPARAAVCIAIAALVVSAFASEAAGQDIETASRLRGIPLPEAYFRQVRADPTLYEFKHGLFGRAEVGRTAAQGEVRLPVVLALFADSPQEPHITREMVQAALFSGPAERGTITQAYLEMSRGALDVGGDVYGWARGSLTMAQVVGTDRGFGPDARIAEYLTEALDSIDGEVDFSQYDNDGPDGVANSGDDDGFVDVITFEYLEVAASCGGPAIWPHRSSLQGRTGEPYKTDDLGISGDTIFVQDYITQSAAACSGDVVQDAAVITHEFGHALGLPDYYHWIDSSLGPYGRRWVMGCWALMAAGAWGCGPVTEVRTPFGPTHMMAHSKWTLGWLDYLEVGEVWNEEIILDPTETTGMALRVPLDSDGNEFLIAEFRDLIGFDAQLPGAGVLLYQQDLTASRYPNPTSGNPYFLTMLEQDGNGSLLKLAAEGGSRGEIGDAWGVGGVSGKLNAETTPRLRRTNGARTPVVVHEVYVDGPKARLIISTGRTPRLIPPAEPFEVTQVRTFAEPVRIAGGTGPYTGVGTLPAGLSLEAAGDELLLVGSVREAGPHEYSYAVRDALGQVSDVIAVVLNAPTEWTVSVVNLLQRFLLSSEEPLTPGELAYLDDRGNGNGQYDIGDLRKWLREQGGLLAESHLLGLPNSVR